MAIVTAQKIFVDVDDEINFVVEKILAAEKQRVILVVPQNALVISSQVSIKILAKQIINSKKLVILVSEDDFGLKLAKAAGIVNTNKVSNISPEMWEAVQIAVAKQKASLDERKKDLLTRRGLLEPEPDTKFDPTESEIEVELADQETEEEEVDDSSDDSTIEAVDEMEELEAEEEIVETEPEVEEEEEVRGAIQRVRPEPKLVKLGNLEVFAGGDVSMIESKPAKDMAENMSTEERLSRINADSAKMQKPKGGYTGKDWTKYTPDRKEPRGLMALFKRQPRRGEEDADQRKRKLMIIAGVVVAALALIGTATYFTLYRWNSVDVTIKLKTQEVPIQQQIKIDSAVQTSNLETLTLPAKVIAVEDLSVSDVAKATGQGKTGTKASGKIELWNFTTQEVQVLNGTVITDTNTKKNYVLKANTTLAAATKAGAVVTPSTKKVDIEAQEVGIDYNIDFDALAQPADFSVAGYQGTQVVGKGIEGKIAGGTTETFVAVAQQDIDTLKKTLLERLNNQGKEQIPGKAESGYRLITGTEVFIEEEVKATPALGEKADEFTLSIKGKMTALVVKNEDLEAAIAKIVLANQDNPEGFEVTGLENAVFAEVKRDKGSAQFVITSAGNVRSKLEVDSVKQEIAGKNVNAARDFLRSVADIESFTVRFSPGFVPEGLQQIPGDFGRISVRIDN